LKYLFKSIGSFESFPAYVSFRPGNLEFESDSDGKPRGWRRQRLGAGLGSGHLDLVSCKVHTG
jgi:hypothetical protein